MKPYKIRNGTTRKRVRGIFRWWATRANRWERRPRFGMGWMV